jgi:hypothetical protein
MLMACSGPISGACLEQCDATEQASRPAKFGPWQWYSDGALAEIAALQSGTRTGLIQKFSVAKQLRQA